MNDRHSTPNDRPSDMNGATHFSAGYQQIYIVKQKTQMAPEHHEVFFQCGGWCYDGFVKLDFQDNNDGRHLTVQDVSNIPRELHRHQDDLSFICLTEHVISESKSFAPALKVVEEANDFIVKELGSQNVLEQVQRIGKEGEGGETFDPSAEDGTFFEFVANIPSQMDEIECICCKTYIKEALICVVYFEGVFYCVLQSANDEQPILDVSFPDVTGEGNGITLAMYDMEENDERDRDRISWVKLSLWKSVAIDNRVFQDATPSSSTVSLSTKTYGQSYCILKPNKPDQSNRDVLFRFGSWCYTGDVDLIEKLCVDDIQHVIPALRAQQSKLAFLCHTSEMIKDNIFTAPLSYISEIGSLMEREVIASESALVALQSKSGLDLEEDPDNMFFQFETVGIRTHLLDNSHIDCIATKTYRPNGLVVMSIYFRGTFYVCLSQGAENQPLLDSDFPSIVQGKGYQIKHYPSGMEGWPELRKLSLWRNAESLAGLEEDEQVETQPKDSNCVDEEVEVSRKIEETGLSSQERSDHKEQDEKPICKPKTSCDSPISQKGIAEPKAKTHFKIEYSGASKSLNPGKDVVAQASSWKKKTRNLGAFHHLAPLKKTSKLEEQIKNEWKRKDINNISNAAGGKSTQWHSDGRPVNL